MPFTVFAISSFQLSVAISIAIVVAIWGAVHVRRRLRSADDELREMRASREEEQRKHEKSQLEAAKLILKLSRDQRALETAKERFLEVVSHELRTPLTGIAAATEILAAQVSEDPDAVEWVEIIERSYERLALTVSRIEEVVQLESTMASSSFQVHGITEVVTDLQGRLSSAITRPDIVVVVESPSLPVGIAASKEHVVRLIELLVENAIQFSPSAGTVQVRCTTVLDSRTEDDRVIVEVLDEGPGIAEEDMPHIFEWFHQVRSAEHGKPDGLGLGLSICRSIAASLGTEVSVRQREPNGSAFSFVLPCYFRSPDDRKRFDEAEQDVRSFRSTQPLLSAV